MTFLLRHPSDNRLHWSDLKRMAECPAIAKHSLLHPKPPTAAMRFGSLVDKMIFGGHMAPVYDGERRGKAWEAFKATAASEGFASSEIVTADEWTLAGDAAQAVNDDPQSAPLLIGRPQVVAQWDVSGIPCAAGIDGVRGGFDVLGSDFIADLKVTTSTQPRAWQYHAWRMLYPAQLTFYADGARSLGHYPNSLHIIGVQAKPPHIVTVLTLSKETIEVCRKMIAGWIETVHNCERSGHWPGYTQSPVTLDPLGYEFTDTEDE